jgi:hypothetical protein
MSNLAPKADIQAYDPGHRDRQQYNLLQPEFGNFVATTDLSKSGA